METAEKKQINKWEYGVVISSLCIKHSTLFNMSDVLV